MCWTKCSLHLQSHYALDFSSHGTYKWKFISCTLIHILTYTYLHLRIPLYYYTYCTAHYTQTQKSQSFPLGLLLLSPSCLFQEIISKNSSPDSGGGALAPAYLLSAMIDYASKHLDPALTPQLLLKAATHIKGIVWVSGNSDITGHQEDALTLIINGWYCAGPAFKAQVYFQWKKQDSCYFTRCTIMDML